MLGTYDPGISIDADPPPYSPPHPSYAHEAATTAAAAAAADFAANADEDVEE